MLFVGRAICGYCARPRTDDCVVVSVLLCLQVGQVHPSKFWGLDGSGIAGVACHGCRLD